MQYLSGLDALAADGETPLIWVDSDASRELETVMSRLFVGLCESEVERFCDLNSITCEVITRDGETQFDPTDDLVARRVRLTITDGEVEAASFSA